MGSPRTLLPVLAAAALVTGCGGDDAPRAHCRPAAGFDNGTSRADGVFLAVVDTCDGGRAAKDCEVGDGTGPIAAEHVDRGIDVSCSAYNQFVGVGLNPIPGYVTGECFGYARTSAREGRSLPAHRCGAAPADALPPAPRTRARPLPAREPEARGRVEDPYGLPPGADPDTRESDLPEPPPWAVLVWRTRDGRRCHEPGQVVDGDTPGRGDQIPGVHALPESLPRPLVGSLRPDSRSGAGIQFYNLGRFLAYPAAEGASCGRGEVTFTRTQLFRRRDLGPDRTIVSGVVGRRVRTVTVAGRPVVLDHGAFVAVANGRRAAADMPVVVTYEDGTTSTFTG